MRALPAGNECRRSAEGRQPARRAGVPVGQKRPPLTRTFDYPVHRRTLILLLFQDRSTHRFSACAITSLSVVGLAPWGSVQHLNKIYKRE
jgi:hypothetical protein